MKSKGTRVQQFPKEFPLFVPCPPESLPPPVGTAAGLTPWQLTPDHAGHTSSMINPMA